MTPRENLMRCLSGGSPEWMPVCVHITNANNLPGHLPAELLAEPVDWLAVSEFVGGDILHEVGGVRTILPDGFGVETRREGDASVSALTTPRGVLTERTITARTPSPRYDLPPGHAIPGPIVTSAHTEYFVKGPADYRVLADYARAQRFEPDSAAVLRETARVGEKGVVVLSGPPPSPLYHMVSSFTGIERLTFDLADAPGEVEEAMAALEDAARRCYEAAAETPCAIVRCTEDLDTKIVSPAMFRRYAAPALAGYARLCRSRGKLFMVHMCGHIRALLPDIRDAGADAVHCLTMPPTGDTPLREARSALAGRTAAMVRIPPAVLLHGSERDVDDCVAGIAAETAGWPNVLVIIPCGRAPLANIRRAIAAGREHGRPG